MKTVCRLCAAVIALTGIAWGMGDKEVIREYEYPRRERVIEREKVIYKEYKHKDWEKCNDSKHHHPPKHHGDFKEVKHKDWEKCNDQQHHHSPAPQHHESAPQHHSSGGQSSGGHSSGGHHKK